jgi:hypothetical protein
VKGNYDIASFFPEGIEPEKAWYWIGTLAGDSQREKLQQMWDEKGIGGWQEAKDYLIETFDPVQTITFVSQ